MKKADPRPTGRPIFFLRHVEGGRVQGDLPAILLRRQANNGATIALDSGYVPGPSN